MHDTFGLLGGTFVALGWNSDRDEEFLLEDSYQLLQDYNPTATEISMTYSLEGLE